MIDTIRYFPQHVANIEEFKRIAAVYDKKLQVVWDDLSQMQTNKRFDDMDEEECSKWEQMLAIRKKDSYTLEERKSLIASRIAEQRPYTFRSLNNMLRILCGEDGYTIALDHAKYSLKIKIALTSKNTYQDVSDLVKRVIPANLLCDIGLMYNTYGFLKGNKHSEMAQYTYKQLRDEVIF